MNSQNYPNSHEIIYLEADINYTIFYLEDGQKMVSSFTLKRHAAKEYLQHFVRINKSYLLNPMHIAGLHREGKIVNIRMSDGRQLPVSRRKKTLVAGLNL
jgi:DNA-binding LytR/AlgR family response regulator